MAKRISEIVDAWIAYQDLDELDSTRQKHWWAIQTVMDWRLERHSERLWQFVLNAYPRELSEIAKATLAAGPLEDLLSKFGEAYIDRIQELALKDDKFNDLLGGVWKSTMSDDVWQRIEQTRKSIW